MALSQCSNMCANRWTRTVLVLVLTSNLTQHLCSSSSFHLVNPHSTAVDYSQTTAALPKPTRVKELNTPRLFGGVVLRDRPPALLQKLCPECFSLKKLNQIT